MASPSKEENILNIILENSPLREWHFEEIVREAKVTKVVANKWLKKYVDNGLLSRVKKKGKFPYFVSGANNMAYKSLKKIYALDLLYSSGLIQQLSSLKTANTIIIFGSWIKGDWYKNSDIDIFIYGSAEGFNKHFYEIKLDRIIELHSFNNKHEIKEVKTGLIKNVVNGYLIKGQIKDIAEVA